MMERFVRSIIRNAMRLIGTSRFAEACPQCNSPILLEKTTKKEGTFRYCKNEDCDYKMPVGNPEKAVESTTEVIGSV